MKKTGYLLTAFLLTFAGITSFAQNVVLKSSDYDKISLTVSCGELKAEKAGEYAVLSVDGMFASREVGKPALPLLVKMLEIPLCDNVIVNYDLGEAEVYDGEDLGIVSQIAPAQPSYPKNDTLKHEFVKDEEVYKTDAYYSMPAVRVEKNGILRSVNLATLYVSPVQYNPVTNKFKVYRNIQVNITFDNADVVATKQMKALHSSKFLPIEKFTVNHLEIDTKDNYSAPVKYLIVANSMFKGYLDDFVAWKRRKGFLVDDVYTDNPAVGTTYNSIKAYIKTQYTNATPSNPAPTFVLLVGDVSEIPTQSVSSSYGSHPSDMRYFDWTGDDIPDCFFGRFSATKVTELTPQIEKTLMYEQLTMPDPSYLDEAILIAGIENGSWSQPAFGYTHANTAIKYANDYYVNTTYGYSTVNVFKNPHASTATTTIKNLIKQGAGLINYTAHGDVTMWYKPQFNASDVSSMTNEGKYGLMIGNCCLSNKFDETSFGETLLRADKKGAVGYIGGTNSTYWDEDVYWAVGCRTTISTSSNSPTTFSYQAANLGAYDRLFHTHSESFGEWYTTFGSMIMAGNMAVQSSSSDADMKTYYWEIYSLDGDPSVMTWLTQPDTMIVTTENPYIGMTSLQVHAVPYSYVALTDSLTLLAAAFADANGDATLSFSAISDFTNIELAVSAQNYETKFVKLSVPIGPQPIYTHLNYNSCEGTAYPFFNQNISVAGTYTHVDSLTAESGVDSIVTSTLVVYPVYSISVSHEICQGDAYNFNGKDLDSSGVYTEKFTTATGCDSVVSLNLKVSSKILVGFNDTICKGDTYDFDGQELSTGGTYTKSYTSSFGCDSVVSLTLVVETEPVVTVSGKTDFCYGENAQIVAGGAHSYTWSNATTAQTLETSVPGTYYVMGSTAFGCTATNSVTLTVNYPSYSNIFVTSEGEYTWNDSIYSVSGTYTQVFAADNNCDSIVTLYLTVTGTSDFISENSSSVNIYPNPSNGIYRISYGTEPFKVFVYDIYGKLVYEKMLDGDDDVVDISGAGKGMYMLRIVDGNAVIGSYKLMKL
ncbi:MAG: T9SS type A sorting domain-containing protein [Bacteroidales bacterium]|nr:T9SS type A sorting domain-containing protein [Bacteroidales bacterium]